MNSAGHVGVVRPAQVEVEVTVRLQNRNRECHVRIKVSFSCSTNPDPPSNGMFHSGSVTMSFNMRKYHFGDTHAQSCLTSLTAQIPDNPAANTAQCKDSALLMKFNMGRDL